MLNGTPTKGGCDKIRTSGVTKPHSFMSLIPLCFSPANRPHPRRSRKIGEDDSDPPKTGEACGPDSGALFHASIRPHEGSLSSSFIPAGRLGAAPPAGAMKEGKRTL